MSCIYRYEFRYEGPISLKFTYLPRSWTEFNFLLSNGITLTNYFEITRSGGARAFSVRGKRMFCRPTPSDRQYRYDYNHGYLCEVVNSRLIWWSKLGLRRWNID